MFDGRIQVAGIPTKPFSHLFQFLLHNHIKYLTYFIDNDTYVHALNPTFDNGGNPNRCKRNDAGFPGAVLIIFQQPRTKLKFSFDRMNVVLRCSIMFAHHQEKLGNMVLSFRLSTQLKWENSVCQISNIDNDTTVNVHIFMKLVESLLPLLCIYFKRTERCQEFRNCWT